MYTEGRGVPRDYAQAVKWYRQAAAQKDPRAERNLGLMYLSGRGVPLDEPQGVAWLEKAAAQGDALAKASLSAVGENRRVARIQNALRIVLALALLAFTAIITFRLTRRHPAATQA
jgi:TPR repeat protein